MKLKETEADIQRTILDYLNLKGHFVVRINTMGVAKWGRGGSFAGFRPSPMKGVSDILGISSTGKFIAIEVKSAKGKASPEQIDFLDKVRARGGIAIVARSLDDVIAERL